MKNTVLLLLSAMWLLSSCDTSSTSSADKQKADSLRQEQDRASLDDAMSKLDVPSQVFSAPGDQMSLVKGRKGTVIFVVPTDLETEDGQPLTDKIIVELKELANQGELARAGAQTLSNDKLLMSGGAYYINMTSGGKQLRPRNGKDIKVAFPRITDSTMMLFYGERNSAGTMNWQPTEQQMTNKNGYGIETGDTASDKSIMVYNPKTFGLMGYVGNDSTFQRDTATLNAMKKKFKDSVAQARVIAYFQRRYTDSVLREKQKPILEATKRLNENLYDITNIKRLGWINVDKLTYGSEWANTSYTIDPKDSIWAAKVYLVFKDINSVIQDVFVNKLDNGTRHFPLVPAGNKVRLVAVANRNGELLASKVDVTIQNNQHTSIVWKNVTPGELNSYFDVNSNWGQ